VKEERTELADTAALGAPGVLPGALGQVPVLVGVERRLLGRQRTPSCAKTEQHGAR